jgi:hypothetical protein
MFLRELKRDIVLAYFGIVLFLDTVRLLVMELICPGVLSTFTKADRMKHIGKNIFEFPHPSLLCGI